MEKGPAVPPKKIKCEMKYKHLCKQSTGDKSSFWLSLSQWSCFKRRRCVCWRSILLCFLTATALSFLSFAFYVYEKYLCIILHTDTLPTLPIMNFFQKARPSILYQCKCSFQHNLTFLWFNLSTRFVVLPMFVWKRENACFCAILQFNCNVFFLDALSHKPIFRWLLALKKIAQK